MKKLLCTLCLLLALVLVFAACNVETLRSINKSEIVNGELVITYSDGTSENLGKVVGENGEKGDKGETGATGAQGPQGEKGEMGLTGAKGPRGEKGENAEIENLQELEFYLLSDDTYGVKAGNSIYLANVVIPEMYKGKKVTKILPYAFADSKETLKSIEFCSNIVEIGDAAFAECENLEEINFGKSNQLKRIGEKAFSHCYAIKNVEIPASVEYIGEDAFRECNRLQTVTFEKNSKLACSLAYVFTSSGALRSIVVPTETSMIHIDHQWVFFSTIYYCGNSEEWRFVGKSGIKTDKHIVYFYSSVRPNIVGGNFWRYVNGVPTPW